MMKPKIIFRYTAGKFWMPFFFAMAVFCILVLLGDFFENIKEITNGYATFAVILKYCLLNLPGVLGLLLPAACLLSCLFVVSDMVSAGEWTACLAGGYRPGQLFLPLAACVVFVLTLNTAMQEFALPYTNRKAHEVFKRKVRGNKDFKIGVESGVTLRVSGNEMMFVQKMESGSNVMSGIILETYNNGWGLLSQTIAKEMVWDKERKRWFFRDGLLREFHGEINIKETPFAEMQSPLKIAPGDISVGDVNEKETSVRDLVKKINFLSRSGLTAHKERTDLHSKLAMPFMTLLMCLMGLPFATIARKKNKIINMVAAMVMSFSFWWIMTIAGTAGKSGLLPPFVAGWGIVWISVIVVLIEFRLMKV